MPDRGNVCRVDDLVIDFARRKVARGGAEIPMPALSFDTFKCLVDAAPASLSTDELIANAWRGAVVSDETVTQRIRLLRQALGDDRRHPRYIETLRGVGYRLIPPVSNASPTPAAFRIVAAMILFGVGVAGAWLIIDQPFAPIAGAPAPHITTGPATAAELVAEAADLFAQRNPASLDQAIRLFEEALRMDPGNAEYRARLSIALSRSVAWYGRSMDVAARAEALARQAAQTGPYYLAESALGFSLDSQGKTEQARAAYERAIALNPRHDGARASLAYLLQVKGRLVEALSHNMIAFENAPAGTLDAQIASCLRLLGFQDVASEWLARVDTLDPDSAHAAPTRALDLMTRGHFDEARDVIHDALERGVEQVELYEYQAILYLRNTDVAGASRVIASAPESISHRDPFIIWRQLLESMTDNDTTAASAMADEILENTDADTWPEEFLYAAMLRAVAGQPEEAINALEQLETYGYRDFAYIQLLPVFETLRGKRGYQDVIDRMQRDVRQQRDRVLSTDWLPDEWRQAGLAGVSP